MGITRDSRHKRRLTGGRMPIHKKKRAFEKGRPLAMTKLTTDRRIRTIRVRGGNFKFRALRLNDGNFSWPSEGIAKKTKILDVVYNSSNNELVRTKTLVKNCIVQIDATPFRNWYLAHYGLDLAAKKAKKSDEKQEPKKQSKHLIRKMESRQKGRVIDGNLELQFPQQRVLACISSRPGQSGKADGYILEGRELEFYVKKIEQKKK